MIQILLNTCPTNAKTLQSLIRNKESRALEGIHLLPALQNAYDICIHYITLSTQSLTNCFLLCLPKLLSNLFPSTYREVNLLIYYKSYYYYYPASISYPLLSLIINGSFSRMAISLQTVELSFLQHLMQSIEDSLSKGILYTSRLLQTTFLTLFVFYVHRDNISFYDIYTSLRPLLTTFSSFSFPLGQIATRYLSILNDDLYMPHSYYIKLFCEQLPFIFCPSDFNVQDDILQLRVEYVIHNTVYAYTTPTEFNSSSFSPLFACQEFDIEYPTLQRSMSLLVLCILKTVLDLLRLVILTQDLSFDHSLVMNMNGATLSTLLRDIFRIFIIIKKMNPTFLESKSLRLSFYKQLLPFPVQPRYTTRDNLIQSVSTFTEETTNEMPNTFGYNIEIIHLREDYVYPEEILPYKKDALGNRLLMSNQEFISVYEKVFMLNQRNQIIQSEYPYVKLLHLHVMPSTNESFTRLLSVYCYLAVENPSIRPPMLFYILPYLTNGVAHLLCQKDIFYYMLIYSPFISLNDQIYCPFDATTMKSNQSRIFTSTINTYMRWAHYTYQIPIYHIHLYSPLYHPLPETFSRQCSPTVTVPFVGNVCVGLITRDIQDEVRNTSFFQEFLQQFLRNYLEDSSILTGSIKYTPCSPDGVSKSPVLLEEDKYICLKVTSIPLIETNIIPFLPLPTESKHFYVQIVPYSSKLVYDLDQCTSMNEYLHLLSVSGNYIPVTDFQFISSTNAFSLSVDAVVYGSFNQFRISRALNRDQQTGLNLPIRCFDAL